MQYSILLMYNYLLYRNIIYWSIRRMAEQCNMSYESVRRAIKSLEDQCLIDVEHCSVNGKKNSNIYTVHRLI